MSQAVILKFCVLTSHSMTFHDGYVAHGKLASILGNNASSIEHPVSCIEYHRKKPCALVEGFNIKKSQDNASKGACHFRLSVDFFLLRLFQMIKPAGTMPKPTSPALTGMRSVRFSSV